MRRLMKGEEFYPTWVCHTCGMKYGKAPSATRMATYHLGTCDVCGSGNMAVTEPRDYGHLRPEWKNHPRPF